MCCTNPRATGKPCHLREVPEMRLAGPANQSDCTASTMTSGRTCNPRVTETLRRVQPSTAKASQKDDEVRRRRLCNVLEDGAPERIRTSDPQIRSLVLYPAELRALVLRSGYIGGRGRTTQRTEAARAPLLLAEPAPRKGWPAAGWSRTVSARKPCRRRGLAYCVCRSGILSSNAAPRSVSMSFRLPPCACASSAAIGKPSPVPPRRVDP